jgi:hypothetical protein
MRRPGGRGGAVLVLTGAVATGLAGALVHACVEGDFLADGRAVITNPWGLATLAEVYAGLALFSGWVLWRERSAVRAGLWIAALVVVGNLAACAYVVEAWRRARGAPQRFWHPRHERL